jgi:O-antigen/teichoic acid export membrane protein
MSSQQSMNEASPNPATSQSTPAATARPGLIAGAWGAVADAAGEGFGARQIMTWMTKGGMAIVDQGLITGSNFLLSILLARWMSREEYGAFALGFSVFLLVGVLYQALLLEPMSVFGGYSYHGQLRTYLRSLLAIHLFAGLAILFGLALSSGIARVAGAADGLPGSLLGAAVAAPCILMFWLVRRAFYLRLSSAFALAGAVLYCVLVVGGLFLLQHYGFLSSFTAFTLMGAGGLLSGALLLFCLHRQLDANHAALQLGEVWRRHWEYGRWALLCAAAMWVPANMYYPLISSFQGVASAGELKALLNFFNPIFQTYGALSLLLLPYAARRRSQGVHPGALTWRITLLCASGTILYWIAVIAFRGTAFRLLYSGRYLDVAHLLPVVALGSVFENAFFGPAIVLRAMEAPKSVFVALFVAAAIALVVGIPATRYFGVAGAVWAQTVSSIAGFAVAAVLLRNKLATPHSSAVTPSAPLSAAQLETEG